MSDSVLQRILEIVIENGQETRALRSDVSEIRTRLGGVETRMASMETRMTSMETRMTGIESRVEQLWDAIAEVRASLTQIRAEIMDRIDRLQDRFQARHDDGVVQFAAIERAKRLMKTTRGDIDTLTEQLNALIRQIRMLTSRVDHLEDRSNAA